MPPARSIFVDESRVLKAIAALTRDATAAVEARQAAATWKRPAGYWQTEFELASWAPRDLNRLAGFVLTESQRKRHQQFIVRAEREGLIETLPRWVRLTDAGRARVAKLEESDG